MEYYMNENYLSHYGVVGMKWGVRRYQNKDGSLTDDGKRQLEYYKTRETAEAVRRGAKFENKHAKKLSKLKQEIAEYKKSGDTDAQLKTKEDYDEARAKLNRAKRITKAEIKKIENMTFKEMRSEKMKSAIEIGIYVTGIAAPLPLSDFLAIAIVGDPYNNKTKRRTGESYYG